MKIIRMVLGNCKSLVVGLLSVILIKGLALAQVTASQDSVRNVYENSGSGGIEAGNSWRNDGFHEVFFRAFYEAEIDNVFLNAGVFSYNKIDDGFGFDFRLRMPRVFYPGGQHKNFSPFAGFSFTVWPSTVSVGIPFGIEYEFPIEHFPNISVSADAAPQITLNSEKNTVIFDVRLGIRFD